MKEYEKVSLGLDIGRCFPPSCLRPKRGELLLFRVAEKHGSEPKSVAQMLFDLSAQKAEKNEKNPQNVEGENIKSSWFVMVFINDQLSSAFPRSTFPFACCFDTVLIFKPRYKICSHKVYKC